MSFIDYELALIQTYSVSKFYKSWIIFYRLGLLVVDDVRNKMKVENCSPWCLVLQILEIGICVCVGVIKLEKIVM
jgi:hypothetical protein